MLAIQFSIQLQVSADGSWATPGESSSTCVLVTHMGDLDWVLGCQLQPDSTLANAGIREVNQQVDKSSLPPWHPKILFI